MAHPLHNKSQRKHSSQMDEHDAYLAYMQGFQSQTISNLLQAALETETIREAQFLEGTEWQNNGSSVPGDEMPQANTGVLGSLVGLFRKNASNVVALRKGLDHLPQTSHPTLTHVSAPTDFLETTSDIHTIDNVSPFQHDSEHEAYLFYTNLAQSRVGTNLLQVALDTEATRDAQFSEGANWQESVARGPDDQTLYSDTTVLGSLVSLFGNKRKAG